MVSYRKSFVESCDVCGKEVKVDQLGNGRCGNCGWHNNKREFTEEANYPNMVSLKETKELYRQGKKLLPSFEGFLDILTHGFEMALWYGGKKYGAMKDGDAYDFYWWDHEEGFQEYETIEEFGEKANIGGDILKDIWNRIKRIEYDC